MKNKLIIFVCVLLVFCFLAAAVKIGSSGTGDNLTFIDGSSGNGFDNGLNENSKKYSWVDPYTGIDIFAYKNIFSFKEGDTDKIVSGDLRSENGVIFHADESVDIPSTIDGAQIDSSYGFTCDIPGYFAVEPGYTYYAYYARELGGTWHQMGLNGGSIREPGTENELPYELGLCNSIIYGVGENSENRIKINGWSFTTDVEGMILLGLVRGVQSGAYWVNTGTFYVRLIAVPN